MSNNLLNLQEIDQEQALSLIRFFIKNNQNIALFGQRGIGKTSLAMQAASDVKLKLVSINLSAIERVDLSGFPNINSTDDIITYKLPYFLSKLKTNQSPDTVLLFDEIDKCHPEITAPLLEILQFRSINGVPLNISGCVLTGNLPNEKAYSNHISSALLDRCSKYILEFNFNNWLAWAREHKLHDLILGFLSSNTNLVVGQTETNHYASPSPRGWTLASDSLFSAKSNKIVDTETIFNIVSGFVGFDAGAKFKTWYQYYRGFEPIILSLLKDGICSIEYKKLQETEKLVFCVSLCHLTKLKFLQDLKVKPNYQSINYMCDFMTTNNVAPEIQLISISNPFPIEFITDPKHKLYNCKKFFDIASKLSLLVK